jgi:hypothetical protein
VAALRQDATVRRQFQLILLNRNSRHYAAALRVLTDYDDDMPANLTPEERAVRIEEILRLARERARLAPRPVLLSECPQNDGPSEAPV